jgi:hypothetical protein
MVIPPHVVPSKMIPVIAEAPLPPLFVRKICWIYWIVFGTIGTISNALAIKNMQDIHRKKSAAHLMKLIPPFFDGKFSFVKDMILK